MSARDPSPDRALAYSQYWRNSLADAELGLGALTRKRIAEFKTVSPANLASGTLPDDIVGDYFHREKDEVKAVEVVLRPSVYAARTEHAKFRSNRVPEILTPLVTVALLARNGRLYPKHGTAVPRDLLEPIQRGSFTIGTVAALDDFLTTDAVPGIEYTPQTEQDPDEPNKHASAWSDYLNGCARMLTAVCSGLQSESEEEALIKFLSHGYIVKKDTVKGASVHILALYDHMRKHRPAAPLFARYASEDVCEPEPGLPSNAQFVTRLAHSSNAYPLAKEQRDALTLLLAAQDGEILAVNGPPGTGKTTLLLTVVASLWAKAALERREAPVILASAANNQAVTNIIDAFGKDFAQGEGPLAGRWLPELVSFGAYLPSQARESESAGKYQTRSFFEHVESKEYILRAAEIYKKAAKAAFPDFESEHVSDIVDRIHRALLEEARVLASIEDAWTHLCDARATVHENLGENPLVAHTERVEKGIKLEAERRLAEELCNGWESYVAEESIFYALFSWLPPVARKRLLRARQFLKQRWPSEFAQQEWGRLDEIEPRIREILAIRERGLHEQQALIRRGTEVLAHEARCMEAWRTALAPFGEALETGNLTLAEVDELADRTIRFRIFLLTTHYWEGQWLLEVLPAIESLKGDKYRMGPDAVAARWRRRMKLTPCAVSTFYMLPKEMRGELRGGLDDYLYDFADLLIVDEAGQALPEVAGASFALAKRALVIGDTLQIEPMWQIPESVDIGNLITSQLISAHENDANYERLSDLGKTVSTGSVMRIAQCATRYHYDQELARGMFLYEHRRCFNEIIKYCNDLCYHGRLKPIRGTKAAAIENGTSEDDGLPPVGYLHIDGFCQQSSGGSRQNLLEAETIAAWLAAHRQKLEKAYGRPLHEIVGVITPFAAQARAIAQACGPHRIAVGGGEGEMTVGTVHSLQGSERRVIIFSPVYSKHADGGFIDARLSMLNVAVSRAKNTFLVFGDMDLFELVPRESPRGQLGSLLFSDAAYELTFDFQPRRPDFVAIRAGITQLQNAAEHDDFLGQVLFTAQREVHIVTPWIRLECVRDETGALEAMAAAVRRGVRVHVYTDYGSNTWAKDEGERKKRRKELREVVDALKARSVAAVLLFKVHSKIVIGDESTYCVGSFNWFSAYRDAGRARHETSLVYRGTGLASEIDTVKRTLAMRAARFSR